MKLTARLAKAMGIDTVVGFTGSSIWQYVAMFPPVPADRIDAGYQDFADRWNPILDVFDECGVRFAHEVHPSEIAYDYWTTERTLEAIDHRPAFGLNWDPSHMMWQDLDPVAFITDFADRIYHVDCKDTRMRMGGGRNGILSSHLPWGDPHRGWDFVSAGRGDVPWEDCFRALAAIGYDGPISVEWEDAGMDRLHGAPEALEFLRRFDYEPPTREPSTRRSAAVGPPRPRSRTNFRTSGSTSSAAPRSRRPQPTPRASPASSTSLDLRGPRTRLAPWRASTRSPVRLRTRPRPGPARCRRPPPRTRCPGARCRARLRRPGRRPRPRRRPPTKCARRQRASTGPAAWLAERPTVRPSARSAGVPVPRGTDVDGERTGGSSDVTPSPAREITAQTSVELTSTTPTQIAV